MKKAKEHRKQAGRRWLFDYEVEAATGGAITAKRLRMDRLGDQIFPFYRVGRNCLYDLPEIDATIEKHRQGGKAAA